MKVLTCRFRIMIKKVENRPINASKSRCSGIYALPCSVYDPTIIAYKVFLVFLLADKTKYNNGLHNVKSKAKTVA